jgi:hypothetical protein
MSTSRGPHDQAKKTRRHDEAPEFSADVRAVPFHGERDVVCGHVQHAQIRRG